MPPVDLPDAKGVGPAFATEPPPPLGERNRKLIEDGCIVQALIELRRLTLFQGPALEEAIPRKKEPRCRCGAQPNGILRFLPPVREVAFSGAPAERQP